MAKKQSAAVLPFTIVSGVTSTGKPCLVLDRAKSKVMPREEFNALRNEVAMLGGFMFRQRQNTAFMNVSESDLISLLRGKTWVENTPKEPAKKVKQALPMDAETAKMFAMFQAFLKASK